MDAQPVLEHLRGSPLGQTLTLDDDLDLGLETDVEPLAGHLLRLFRVYDDALAFEHLVGITQLHLRQQAGRLCRKLGVLLDPDDLVASFMARLFTEVRRDQPVVHRFFGLAYRTMRYDALNQLRLDRRARKRGELWESMKVLDGRTQDPARVVSENESARTVARLGLLLAAVVGQCFHSLRADDRRVLWCREIDGLDYDRLAEAVDKPRKQIGMVLKRARERLARRVESSLLAQHLRCAPAAPARIAAPVRRAAPRATAVPAAKTAQAAQATQAAQAAEYSPHEPPSQEAVA